MLGLTTQSFGTSQETKYFGYLGDDIGQSNLSVYTKGLMGYRAPNIDRIANEGKPRVLTEPPLTRVSDTRANLPERWRWRRSWNELLSSAFTPPTLRQTCRQVSVRTVSSSFLDSMNLSIVSAIAVFRSLYRATFA